MAVSPPQQLSLVTFYTCIARVDEDGGPGAFLAPIIDHP